jgi:hypothetical protein
VFSFSFLIGLVHQRAVVLSYPKMKALRLLMELVFELALVLQWVLRLVLE